MGTAPSNNVQMFANSQIGFTSGLQVNGRPVSALQMNAVFLGLDLEAIVGPGAALTTTPPPDPMALLLNLVGTCAVDHTFSDFGSIWASGPGGGPFTFRVDSLTIAAVPEPETYALMLAGLGLVGCVAKRRKQAGVGVPAGLSTGSARQSGQAPLWKAGVALSMTAAQRWPSVTGHSRELGSKRLRPKLASPTRGRLEAAPRGDLTVLTRCSLSANNMAGAPGVAQRSAR